jgi:ribosome maturation factor RimP
MLNPQLIEQAKDLITAFLDKQEFYLVEISHFCQGNVLSLRIIVDRPEGGISIGECASLNNQIGKLLDEKGILETRYILEVSSPGIDRPLVNEKDFLRCLDKEVKFFFTELVNGKLEIEGVIKRVENGSVYVDVMSVPFEAPLLKIAKAKRIIN